jgi:hypothetical protein
MERSEIKWSEVKWSDVKWSDVKWSEGEPFSALRYWTTNEHE